MGPILPEGAQYREIKIQDQVYYTEETLFKVYKAIRRAGVTEEFAEQIINEMQNDGILFRERIPPIIKPKTIITRGSTPEGFRSCSFCPYVYKQNLDSCPGCGTPNGEKSD